MRRESNSVPVRLDSWKEIAAYLGRGVRTVQRWERELKLPVHRIGSGRRSPVYALPTELNFWVSTSDAARHQTRKIPLQIVPKTSRPVENSKRLMADIHNLAHTLAENSVRQRLQAEMLEKRIREMRSRIGEPRKKVAAYPATDGTSKKF